MVVTKSGALIVIVILSGIFSCLLIVNAERTSEQESSVDIGQKREELAKIATQFKEAAQETKSELESDQRSHLTDLIKGDLAELGAEARSQYEGVKKNISGGFNWAFLGLKDSWVKSVEKLSKEVDETFERLKKEREENAKSVQNAMKDNKQD